MTRSCLKAFARRGWAPVLLLGLALAVAPLHAGAQALTALAGSGVGPAAVATADARAAEPSTTPGAPSAAVLARAQSQPPAVCHPRRRWTIFTAVIAAAVVVNVFITRHFHRLPPCDNCLAGAASFAPAGSLAAAAWVEPLDAAAAAAATAASLGSGTAGGPAGPQCISGHRFWAITAATIALGTALNIVVSHASREKCIAVPGGPSC